MSQRVLLAFIGKASNTRCFRRRKPTACFVTRRKAGSGFKGRGANVDWCGGEDAPATALHAEIQDETSPRLLAAADDEESGYESTVSTPGAGSVAGLVGKGYAEFCGSSSAAAKYSQVADYFENLKATAEESGFRDDASHRPQAKLAWLCAFGAKRSKQTSIWDLFV